MGLRRVLLFTFSAIFFTSCINNQSSDKLYSVIDGKEHADILEGKVSVNKNTLLILYNRFEEVDLLSRVYISDSLSCSDTIWQSHYLNAVFKMCTELKQNEKKYVGPNLFYYFLHHPKQFYLQLNDLPLNESDCVLSLIGQEIKHNTSQEDITLNSIKNLTVSNCISCNESQILAIYQYIDLADKIYFE